MTKTFRLDMIYPHSKKRLSKKDISTSVFSIDNFAREKEFLRLLQTILSFRRDSKSTFTLCMFSLSRES